MQEITTVIDQIDHDGDSYYGPLGGDNPPVQELKAVLHTT